MKHRIRIVAMWQATHTIIISSSSITVACWNCTPTTWRRHVIIQIEHKILIDIVHAHQTRLQIQWGARCKSIFQLSTFSFEITRVSTGWYEENNVLECINGSDRSSQEIYNRFRWQHNASSKQFRKRNPICCSHWRSSNSGYWNFTWRVGWIASKSPAFTSSSRRRSVALAYIQHATNDNATKRSPATTKNPDWTERCAGQFCEQ